MEHTTAEERNSLGCLVALALGCLLNVVGVGLMVVRELVQSRKGGFALEVDDVERYVAWGLVGCVINVGLVLYVWKEVLG